MAILNRTWTSTLALLLTLSGCGGSGGGGAPGATTFAKVYGENISIDALSVLPASDGYQVFGSAHGNTLAMLELDSNGNQVGDAQIAGNAADFSHDSPGLLPDGRINVRLDFNRTLNLYTLHVKRAQFSSDLSQPPSELWHHAQVMDYGTTPWRSDDADINGYPARLQFVERLQLETAVSSAGFQGAFVLLRETAFVETTRYGITQRTRIMLFHYDANGALQAIRQIDERALPLNSWVDGTLTPEERIFKKWVELIELGVGRDGSYAIAIPDLQASDNYNYTTAYEVSAYDSADGLRWTQTLGPWATTGSGYSNFMSIGRMVVESWNTNVAFYIEEDSHDGLRYLGLDTSGGILWDLDLDSLNLLPVDLACSELGGGCLFAALSDSTRHLLLWDDQGSQVGDFDLAGTGISSSSFVNFTKQFVGWPDRAFRLLLRKYSDPVDRFVFHIALGSTNATLSNQGDSLWQLAGTVNAVDISLNPYGYTATQLSSSNAYSRYDSSNSLLYDSTRYAGAIRAPASVAQLPDGRTLALAGESRLIFMRDGQIEQRLAAPGGLIPKSIVALAVSDRFMVIGVNGWAVYNPNGALLWSSRPLIPESSPYGSGGYASLGATELDDGDLLLSGRIYGLSQPTLLYTARVASDGSPRWQRIWTLADELPAEVVPLSVDDGTSVKAIVAIVNFSSASGQPAITLLNLDPLSGDIILRKDLSPRGAGGEINRPIVRKWVLNEDWGRDDLEQLPLRLKTSPQGGFWLGYTSSALVSREIAYDKEGNPESMPYGGDNMALIRFNANLEPDRLRVYGAGGDEQLNDIHVLDDGSLLVAGNTTSFALGWDGNEQNSDAIHDAWILRLDASGNISEGCQSLLASFDGAAANQYMGAADGTPFAESSALSSSLTLTPFTVPTQLSTDTRNALLSNRTLETARMCLGSVTAPPQPPLPDPTPGGDFTLTLTIEGGPGAGQVYSLPAPPAFQCINSAEPTTVCSHDFAAGTPVNLLGEAFGATTLSWTGCDMASSDGCLVNMNADRQVTASFAP